MIKIFITLFSMLFLFLTSTFSPIESKVKVEAEYPRTVKAGAEFIMAFHIDKGSISGAARLQQNLPIGFSAENVESHGGDFVFEDNAIKFIWAELPKENEFVIKYKIKTTSTLIGAQKINGVFIFTSEGKTEKQPLYSAEIYFADKIDDEKQIVRQTEDGVTPVIERKLIKINPEQGEYKVELTIHPNNVSESAQFTDEIPQNFSATLVDAHEAAFSFINQSVVFNWKKLPAEKEFTVSYMVSSGVSGPSPEINGTLVYGDETTIEKEVEKQSPITKLEDPSPISEPNQAETKVAVIANEKAKQETIIANNNAAIQQPSSPLASSANTNTIPSAETGIYFKIQISATQKSSVKSTDWFHAKYHINNPVELTYHEGWKKYIIGSFSAFNEANTFKLQTQEKISDAFVVAYQNGVRIPLNDALNKKPAIQ